MFNSREKFIAVLHTSRIAKLYGASRRALSPSNARSIINRASTLIDNLTLGLDCNRAILLGNCNDLAVPEPYVVQRSIYGVYVRGVAHSCYAARTRTYSRISRRTFKLPSRAISCL